MIGNENPDKFGISNLVGQFDAYQKEEKDATVGLGTNKFLIRPIFNYAN